MRLFILISILINFAFSDFIVNNYNDKTVANRVAAINKKINTFKTFSTLDKLKLVNSFFNSHITYASDLAVYGKKDYRATIQEIVLTMKGDCDDYVFAKMQALLYLGINSRDMIIATTKESNGVVHMKLYVIYDQKIYVLDNYNKSFRLLTDKERLLELSVLNGNIYEQYISNKLALNSSNNNNRKI